MEAPGNGAAGIREKGSLKSSEEHQAEQFRGGLGLKRGTRAKEN
jgi:hypothetical protein